MNDDGMIIRIPLRQVTIAQPNLGTALINISRNLLKTLAHAQ